MEKNKRASFVTQQIKKCSPKGHCSCIACIVVASHCPGIQSGKNAYITLLIHLVTLAMPKIAKFLLTSENVYARF